MNVNNKYFDCIVENNRFRIVESSKKPKQSNAALEILEKIECILKNKLSYEFTFDNYSKYTQDELYNILKEKAAQIQIRFQEKESKQGALLKNEKKVNIIMARIENYLNPPNVLSLNDDVTHEIICHLEIRDLGNFAQVNRHGRYHVAKTMIERAKKFGFIGDNHINSGKYLKNLLNDIKKLTKDNVIPKKYFENNKITENILNILISTLSPEDLIKILLYQGIYSKFPNTYPFLLKCTNECLSKILPDREIINIRNSKGETALMEAVNKVKIEMIQLLIEHKADPNIISQITGATPLLHACYNGNYDLVKLLVNYEKTDINAGDTRHGSTPLHICAKKGYCDIARLLLSHEVSIDKCSAQGITALFTAVSFERKEVLQLLIEYGADPNITSPINDISPLYHACDIENFDLVKLLVNYEKTDINAGNTRDGSTSLQFAAMRGYCDIARLLISHGASIDKCDAYGAAALNHAVWSGHKELVQLLIEHEANPNFIIRNSGASLHLACMQGNVDLVELLVNYEKTDINLHNLDGKTPLSIAKEGKGSIFYKYKISTVLIEHGGTV